MKISIKGKEYPGRATMGALLRFKRETGKDVSEIKDGDVEGQCLFLYCCVKSASNADGVPFDLTFEDFCDSLEPQVLTDWAADVTSQGGGGDAGGGEKKR